MAPVVTGCQTGSSRPARRRRTSRRSSQPGEQDEQRADDDARPQPRRRHDARPRERRASGADVSGADREQAPAALLRGPHELGGAVAGDLGDPQVGARRVGGRWPARLARRPRTGAGVAASAGGAAAASVGCAGRGRRRDVVDGERVPAGQTGDGAVRVRAHPAGDVGVAADGEDDRAVVRARVDRDGHGVAAELEHTGLGDERCAAARRRRDEHVVGTPHRRGRDAETDDDQSDDADGGDDQSLEHAGSSRDEKPQDRQRRDRHGRTGIEWTDRRGCACEASEAVRSTVNTRILSGGLRQSTSTSTEAAPRGATVPRRTARARRPDPLPRRQLPRIRTRSRRRAHHRAREGARRRPRPGRVARRPRHAGRPASCPRRTASSARPSAPPTPGSARASSSCCAPPRSSRRTS